MNLPTEADLLLVAASIYIPHAGISGKKIKVQQVVQLQQRWVKN
jgi:hypothetical protein